MILQKELGVTVRVNQKKKNEEATVILREQMLASQTYPFWDYQRRSGGETKEAAPDRSVKTRRHHRNLRLPSSCGRVEDEGDMQRKPKSKAKRTSLSTSSRHKRKYYIGSCAGS